MSEEQNNDSITLADIRDQVKSMRKEIDSIRKAQLRKTLLSGLVLPLIVALVAFVVLYQVQIKPDRIKSQAEFQFTHFVNNINRVDDKIEELEQEGKPVAKEKEDLGKVKEYSESFNTYYNAGKFADALRTIQEADEVGRGYFPDKWTRYPYPTGEVGVT